jgi:hypothetical protein
MVYEPMFARQSTGVARQRSIRANNTMAGYDDSAAIHRIRMGDGAHRQW